jgi:hypothetical protein
MSNSDVGGQGWRLVREIAEPHGSQDEQWVAVGLTAALEGIDGLSPDLERVTNAAVAAVKRAGGCRTRPASMGQPLTVRVLISSTMADGIALGGWGFFVLERDGADAALDREGRPISHCIELCLYTDGG